MLPNMRDEDYENMEAGRVEKTCEAILAFDLEPIIKSTEI
jgi:hypothetical protein